MSRKLNNSLIIVLILCGIAPAAEAQGNEKRTGISRTEVAPVIDGYLDEPLWAAAVVVDDLHQASPVEFSAASEKTIFLLTYDDDALYVGVRVFEQNPEDITAKVLRNGRGLRSEDRVKVILDPFNDKRSGYDFETNANGVRHDGLYKGSSIDFNWDGIWDVQSQRNDEGWTAEMRIPFKTLSFGEEVDWGLNLTREIVRHNERITWSSRDGNYDPAVAGTLSGLSGIDQGMGLDIVPSVNFTNQRLYSPSSDSAEAEPSLDVYYKLTSGLNASLTLNTDFSATEADGRQVNLTRFGLFFPEKRSFFLRESDIFEFGGIGGNDNSVTYSRADLENGRPYFSRRIGLSGTGEPVDLDVGAKVSGRVGRFNLGMMAIRQDEFEDVDAGDIVVARATANVLSESAVGFIVTSGDPRSNRDNSLVGADFQYQNSRLSQGRRLAADAWYQQSSTTGLEGDDSSFGVSLNMPNRIGWRGGLSALEIQENFFPAVGFVNRAGVRQFRVNAGYTYQHNGERVRSIFAGVDAQRTNEIDGGLQSEKIVLRLFEIESPAEDRLKLRHEIQTENLQQPFEISDGVIIAAGVYDFDNTIVVFESSEARNLDVGLEYKFGEFFDGDISSISGSFGWRPSEHLRIAASYSVDDVNLPSGSFETRLASTEIEIAFSNTVFWTNLLQYDNVSDSVGINSRLQWSPQAGRNVYFVVNHNFVERPLDSEFHSTATDLTLKFDYTFRF